MKERERKITKMKDTKKLLMSIKPKYANQILAGTKKYEFRKQMCRENIENIKSIIIYSCYPDKCIYGEAELIDILKDTPENIWNITKENAGIDKKSFFEYFGGKDIAYAYVLGKIKKYEVPKHIEEFGLKHPPQSYCYINVKD